MEWESRRSGRRGTCENGKSGPPCIKTSSFSVNRLMGDGRPSPSSLGYRSLPFFHYTSLGGRASELGSCGAAIRPKLGWLGCFRGSIGVLRVAHPRVRACQYSPRSRWRRSGGMATGSFGGLPTGASLGETRSEKKHPAATLRTSKRL